MLRITGIRDRIAYRHMCEIIKKRPLDINIETISFCPMKCRFCCNRLYERASYVMDNELFEKIIVQYCEMGGGTLGIGSMQSDFLSDPVLNERMDIIRKYRKNLWVHSTTPLITATKYSDEELRNILENFDFWVISAEGHDQESYREMAGVDGFKIFYEQLERVGEIIEKNSLGIDIEIAFRTCNSRRLRKSEFYKKVSRLFYTSILDSFFSWFGSIKESDLPTGARLHLSCNKGKKVNCVVPNATLAMQASGKVVGCGCIDWLEQYCIGDIRKNSLKEIWSSAEAQQFRQAFERGELPTICEECGLYTPVTCLQKKRLMNYNSLDGLYYWRKHK